MNIVVFIGPAILAILGIIMKIGKLSLVVSNYGEISRCEKEKDDEKKLRKLVSNVLLILSSIFIIIAFSKLLNPVYFTSVAIMGEVIIFFIMIVPLIYIAN
ncbi:DUF3784 domain-containing protein [Clostridium niameyense]|uniref:DUF3784 domain-containing protein n=1 Tax=Clostridium niameyense TaxID=1622073 RepID=A0A6M0R9U4_9CLOT|nr:DUF3784 domain-containing protein [Clostridium niameyense]NEZ46972.1 DUF3784 domain-containing protein [Clostridium niameyense]